jgi:hypothetical protein
MLPIRATCGGNKTDTSETTRETPCDGSSSHRAEVAELPGDSKRVAADHYVYALIDYREIKRGPALRRLFR